MTFVSKVLMTALKAFFSEETWHTMLWKSLSLEKNLIEIQTEFEGFKILALG